MTFRTEMALVGRVAGLSPSQAAEHSRLLWRLAVREAADLAEDHGRGKEAEYIRRLAGQCEDGKDTPAGGESTRSYWDAIADALNAALDGGLPLGIDLDGTLTDHNAWSVIWDQTAERWTVAEYDDGEPGPCDCGEGAVHYSAADCPHEQRRATGARGGGTVEQLLAQHDDTLLNQAAEPDEYRYCGADLGRAAFPFTCNRRIAHEGACGPERDDRRHAPGSTR